MKRPAREILVDGGVVAGNVYDKYGTGNPIARALMSGFLRAFGDLVDASGVQVVHEVGCGEGELCLRLAARGLQVRGCDVSPAVIAEAERRSAGAGREVPFRVASIYDLAAPDDAAELVVCCEVLEHLEEPERALQVLVSLARPYLLLSVPREPLWSGMNLARLRYVGDWGNTPGHAQRWSKRGFVELVSRYAEPVEVRSPLPWTMVLARV